MADMKAVMEKEGERINEAIRDAEKRIDLINAELDGYKREKKALVAYQSALSGGTRKATGTKRGSRQDGIIAALKDSTDGLTRGDILDKLGLKGNKTGEQSISNALANLKKANKIGSKDGKYVLA